ncbi:MAG: SpoVG family protein [Verrucomicrobiota bacterium]|nr:SpoVG family protein [Verrucomicrobiota bacterium]
MTITEVSFHGEARNEFLSYVTVVFDNVFVVTSLKLIKSRRDPERLMLCMPSRQKDDGSYADIAHPITPQMRQYMTDHVLNAWDRHRAFAHEPQRS